MCTYLYICHGLLCVLVMLTQAESYISPTTFLFATLSNYQKITPEIFHVWMNILQTVAGSKMVGPVNTILGHACYDMTSDACRCSSNIKATSRLSATSRTSPGKGKQDLHLLREILSFALHAHRMFGVPTSRMVLTPQAPWIDHLLTKTAIDMVLDTPSKNGHTTGGC